MLQRLYVCSVFVMLHVSILFCIKQHVFFSQAYLSEHAHFAIRHTKRYSVYLNHSAVGGAFEAGSSIAHRSAVLSNIC